MPPGPRFLRVLCALALGCSLVACNLENEGDPPPSARLYFPNGLALSPHANGEAARYLYVTNSDFDLRYNAGTLQAYSLDKLAAAIDDCDEDPCQLDPGVAFETEVPIPAFSTAITSSRDGERLLITTRTGDGLTYVRADPSASGDAVLPCAGSRAECAKLAAGGGRDRFSGGELVWPEEPVSVLSGELSDWSEATFHAESDEYALVAHRGGEISLLLELDGELSLANSLKGGAYGATDLAYDAVSGQVYATTLLPATPRVLSRIEVSVEEIEGAPDPDSASVVDAGEMVLRPVDADRDTRAIAFLPAIPGASAALATPSALIAVQRPSSLLLADVANADAEPLDSAGRAVARVKGTAMLGVGASRVAAGVVNDVPVAVVACFESRELALVDLRTMLTRSVVPNLSGPFAVALDEARKLVYVTDFRSSVIRILDIGPALEPGGSDPVEVVATLGKPRVLQELR